MPELPEVETVKLQLQTFLVGHTIESIDIKNRRIFAGGEDRVLGSKVIDVRRFGKVLVIDLSNNTSLVTHIKLTGQYIYRGPNLENPVNLSKKVVGGVPGPHTHVIFHFDRGGILYYNDIRRFGWIKVVQTDKLKEENKFIASLGPEPFRDLTFEIFENILSKTKRAIKVVIMDQSKIGGVGNIYASDALWLARIDPKRAANSLSPTEQQALYSAILNVLEKGLKYGGASELAFVTPDGTEGSYQMHSLVYGKTGEVCKNCKSEKIKKYMLGGRGTYVCTVCQR